MPAEPSPPDRAHWLIARRVRDYPVIVLVMFTLGALGYALTISDGLDPQGRTFGTDFIAFWSAARLHVGGETLSAWDGPAMAAFQAAQFPGLGAPTVWAYPPMMLALVAPLGHLSYGAAFVVWTSLGLLGFLLALSPLLPGRRAWVLALAFPGVWIGIAHGQTQFVVGALLGGALVLLGRRPVLAGVLIGLLVVKPHLAVLLPVALLAGRHGRAFASAAVTSVAVTAASTAWLGVDVLRAWLEEMGAMNAQLSAGDLPVYKFVTPFAGLRLLGLPEPAAMALHGVVALGAVATVWWVWRRSTDMRLRGTAVVLGTFLVTPYSADYDLALLAFAIAWWAALGLDAGWRRGERNLLVVLWCLPILAAVVAMLTHVSPTPIALVVGLVLVRRRVLGEATEAPRSAREQGARAQGATG